MKKNLAPLLGVAFVAAVVATGLFYGLLIGQLRTPAPSVPSGQVVVAAKTLERGALLRPEDLKTVRWATGAPPANACSSVEQAVGLTLLEPLAAEQPLTQAVLAPRGAAGGPSLAIPPGMRAVSIHPGESTGVVALLRSGSRVDVQVLEGKPPAGMRLRRLLQNVEVLSTGDAESARSRPVVTLLVSPADADRLSLADAALQIRLVLRNPADTQAGDRSELSPAVLLNAPAANPPVPRHRGAGFSAALRRD
jgi:pilus assembly protein CpaB